MNGILVSLVNIIYHILAPPGDNELKFLRKHSLTLTRAIVMEVKLELKCLQTLKTERLKLTVFDWDNMYVKDLKVTFQNEIEVPACDQKLTYQGRPLSDDLFPLRKLYFRDGDLIVVEFLAKANLAEMRYLLEDLKNFSERIVRQDQNQLLTVSPKKLKESAFWYVNHDLVVHALGEISFSFFIPWKDPKSQVHRHFFVQEGGFSAFMEVLKFASKRYRMEDKPSSRLKFGKGKGKDVDELARQLQDLNNEQMVLQMHCLSLLWNFSETAHDRRLVLQNGGLQHVIMALLLDPNHYSPVADEFWEVASINETAVGCLVQYAEFADCQEIIARNSETVNKLLCMVECQRCSPTQEMPETYSKYSTQIAANTLFCCACSLQTPPILVQSSMLHRMINLTSNLLEGNCDLALRYYCTLFLARIRSSPLVRLGAPSPAEIDRLITCFLGKHKPLDIAAWEEKHNYVWVSLVPFVSLAFTGTLYSEERSVFVKQEDSSFKELETSSEQTDGPSSCSLNLLTDKALSKCNATVAGYSFNNSGMSNVNFDSDSREPVLKLVCGADNLQNSIDPVLHYSTSKLLGSEQTHKLGLFTLQHMLLSSENRKLLEAEKLLPYLYCLCWHLGPENGTLLRNELRKHWSQTPPPLTVICKSVLAFISGFEVVLKI